MLVDKIIVPLSSRITKTGNHIAEIAQLVEHDLAKVGVASSSLVFRSQRCRCSSVVEYILGKDGVAGSTPANGSQEAVH